ncbi:MAG: hypothetical protein LQ351_006689 [Letrouitia transgressa]|nr:MAG: hypothetical protein LQ351_006689 [Letrouitia transgressa]
MHLSTSFLALASVASFLIVPTFAELWKPPGEIGPTYKLGPVVATARPLDWADYPGRGDPRLEKRVEHGWCTLHFVQYEKHVHGRGGKFVYYLRLYDANKHLAGEIGGIEIADHETKSFRSKLEFLLNLEAGVKRSDPILFRYSSEVWSTSDKQCKVGEYGEGSREGDCRFEC